MYLECGPEEESILRWSAAAPPPIPESEIVPSFESQRRVSKTSTVGISLYVPPVGSSAQSSQRSGNCCQGATDSTPGFLRLLLHKKPKTLKFSIFMRGFLVNRDVCFSCWHSTVTLSITQLVQVRSKQAT